MDCLLKLIDNNFLINNAAHNGHAPEDLTLIENILENKLNSELIEKSD